MLSRSRGVRQGSFEYNVSRLQRYLARGTGEFDDDANRLLRAAQASSLDSYASLYRSRRIYELPMGWPAIRPTLR